jgi:hypothetical protein
VTVAVAVAAAYVLLPLAAAAFVRLLTLTLNGSVWLAASLSSGVDGWTILATMVGAAAEALSTPEASVVVAALILVSAFALFGLRHLLGSEGESSK